MDKVDNMGIMDLVDKVDVMDITDPIAEFNGVFILPTLLYLNKDGAGC